MNVGDKVIYIERYGARPAEATVTKVTKAGWAQVDKRPGILFVPTGNGEYRQHGKGRFSAHSCLHVPPSGLVCANDPKMEVLNQIAADHEKVAADKQAENNRRIAERNAQIAAELAEAKEACGGFLRNIIKFHDTLPDGSRVVYLSLPVKPDLAERKKFEVVICRLKDENSYLFCGDNTQQVRKVNLYVTYLTGNNSSFPSCYGSHHDSDEEALWEAARQQYHNSW